MTVDMSPEQDLDVVAGIAAELSLRIRDEDPRRLFDELVDLCRFHPAKAAQLLQCHAAWFDPETPTSVLIGRAQAITAPRMIGSAS